MSRDPSQILLIKSESGTMMDAVPMGSLEEVTRELERFNIATDNAPESMNVLYGPGLTVQLPFVGPGDPVTQLLVSIDEDIAWPVLGRIVNTMGWKLLDPATGQSFGGGF